VALGAALLDGTVADDLEDLGMFAVTIIVEVEGDDAAGRPQR